MCSCNKIWMQAIVLIILVSQTLAAPQNESDPRIIGGYPCYTTQVPCFVIVLNTQGCGGSLLSYQWVLTAAHCILPKYFKGVIGQVYSGFDLSHDLKQVRKVKKAYIHPKFVAKDFDDLKDLRYDIGLVLVNKPFYQTAAAHVVTLPLPGFTKKCKKVMAIGIGLTSNRDNAWMSEHRPIKCVNLSIVDTKTCKKLHSPSRFDDSIICTHEPKKDTCLGDSGGPVFCEDVVVGIVSLGPVRCGATKYSPATYTKVESYLGFIEEITGFKLVKEISAKEAVIKPHANIVQTCVSNWKFVLFIVLFWIVQ